MFELLIAVPLGIVAATKQYSVTDYTVTTVALLGMSLPTFFFATPAEAGVLRQAGLVRPGGPDGP